MNSLPLQGKVAVVTGAGGTMGRAVVEALLADGCRVAAIDIHPDSMRPLVVANGSAVLAVACDISHPAAVVAAHATVIGTLGQVDILVNNAGVLSNNKIEATDVAEWRRVLGGVGSLWGAVLAGLLVGLAVGLTGAYASEWSLLSMYLLFIAIVTFRARGLFGKKSVLDA